MHAIIFGGVIDYYHHESIKRAPGAHRIATHLRREGMDVEVVDFVQSWTSQQLKDFFINRVRKDTVFVGVSATFNVNGFESLEKFLSWLKVKYPDIPVVAGTQSYYNASDLPIDWLLHGYGEVAISALVRHLTNIGTDLKYESHGNYNYINATKHYDATKLRDFTIDYEERDFIAPQEVLTIELGRGCIFNCGFCTLLHRNIKGDHSRTEDNLYDELLRNYETWGTTHYTFSDETVNDYTEKLYRYSKVITKLPFRPRFGGYIRGDLLVSRPEDWDMIWDLGLDSHFYGIESFNREAAKKVGKGMETGRLQDGLLAFRDHFNDKGFYRGHINLIAGLPGDNPDTLNSTAGWLETHWWPHDSAFMNPLWIPTEVAREYDETNNFAKDPEKWGYTKTTIKESNPNNDDLIVNPHWPLWKQLYDGLKERDEMQGVPRPKGGGTNGMTFMNWKNGSTNVYEMLKFLNDKFPRPAMRDQPPTVFSYHNWLIDPKYTWDDMKKPQRTLEVPVEYAREFIQKYIQKKLNF